MEKGADYVENYFNRIDQIFVNIKTSSNPNSFRILGDALFTDILDDGDGDEDKDNIVMKEIISQDNNNIDNSEITIK